MIPSTAVLANTHKVTGGGGGGGGGGGPAASITARTVSGITTASYTLNAGGTVTNHDGATLETWLDSGTNSQFQGRATLLSGTLDFGVTGVWSTLNTSQVWGVSANTIGTQSSATILVEIRLTASPFTVLTSANIVLAADNT